MEQQRSEGEGDEGTSRGGVRRFGALRIELVRGDIAYRLVDAVANAANDQLAMGGGVAAALRAVGGVSIEREATAHAPAPLGVVIRTRAGDLLAKYVYHAVVIRYSLAGGTGTETVREVVRGVLACASEDEIDSLALPLFGAGVGGLSIARSLETVLDALEEFAPTISQPLAVEVVVLDGDEHEQARATFDAFRSREAREAHEAELAQDYLQALLRRADPPS